VIETPEYAWADVAAIRELIRTYGWATLVSSTPDGPVASHLPVLLEEREDDELVVVGHVGRPDDVLHGLGTSEVLLVVAGPHGYVSPGWYGTTPAAPTWDFAVAHLYGTPQVLDAEASYQVLSDTTDHYEGVRAEPVRLPDVAEYARRIAKGAVSFRLPVRRVQAKLKMSQNRPVEVVERIVDALRTDAHYANPELAGWVARANGLDG
jgi:transcriptional regulator